MKTTYEIRTIIDAVVKYMVLFMIISYIGECVHTYLLTGTVVNMPDWIVSLFTIVIIYFFRKSPEKEVDNGAKDKVLDKEVPQGDQNGNVADSAEEFSDFAGVIPSGAEKGAGGGEGEVEKC